MMNVLTVKSGIESLDWDRIGAWNWREGPGIWAELMGCSRFFHAGRFLEKSPAFKLPNYQLFTYLCSRN
jgi:hypothetical protein